MAGRSSLNAKNLEGLGAARLATLLLQHTEGNAAARRALRLALAEQRGPLEMAQEVRKRLAAVERSSSWLDQKRRDALLADLDRQRQAIVGPIATHDPDLAMELLWRFLDLASSLQDRRDCSDDAERPLFHQASADLGQVACVFPAQLIQLRVHGVGHGVGLSAKQPLDSQHCAPAGPPPGRSRAIRGVYSRSRVDSLISPLRSLGCW
jgi:hypothetical protein